MARRSQNRPQESRSVPVRASESVSAPVVAPESLAAPTEPADAVPPAPERVRFRASNDLAKVMQAEGLSVEIVPAWGKTPFSNVLLIGTRTAA